jgi:hypothetical protein
MVEALAHSCTRKQPAQTRQTSLRRKKKNKWYERRVADKRFRAPLVLQMIQIVVSSFQNMTKYYYAVSLRRPGTPKTLGIAGYGSVVDE